MVDQCKQCIAAQNSGDFFPRQEIIEYCTVFLLNMCEWEYLMNVDKKRAPYLEFAAAISNVCQDIKFKGFRKFFPRESWDLGNKIKN